MTGFIGTSSQMQLIITAHTLNSFWRRLSCEWLWRVSPFCLNLGLVSTTSESESESRVTLRPAVYRQSVRIGAEPLATHGQNFFSQLNTCGHSPYITSSLTRGWVCHLQLLLTLASAFSLGSESHGTRTIFYCLKFETSLFVVSYVFQG
jgi:hypothetical protein